MAIKNWIKTKAKKVLIATGIIGVALAAGEIIQPTIPSIVAEGQTISFPYTDENSNENLIIRTDQAVYNPLWAWNGFDVYVAVENKSGISQPVSFQSFFSKDFSVEEVSVLNPNATSTIDICPKVATSSKETVECYKEIVLGVWNPIVQQQFSKEAYDKTISDNNIPVKQKIGDKVSGNFVDYSLKDQFSYYKLRIKANEFFSQEEFFIEAIGQTAYGILDPTILIDNFNTYNNGNLSGQGSWTGSSYPQVQAGSADNPEGAGVGKEVIAAMASGNDWLFDKIGTETASGSIAIWMKVSNVTYTGDYFVLRGGASVAVDCELYGDTWFIILGGVNTYFGGTITPNVGFWLQVQWDGTNFLNRARIDDGAWSDWGAMVNNVNPDRIHFDLYSPGGAHTVWFDYIAENPLAGGGTAEPQMNVIIIE